MTSEILCTFIEYLERFGHVKICGLVDTRISLDGPKNQEIDVFFDGDDLCLRLNKYYVLKGTKSSITIEDNNYDTITILLAFLFIKSLNKKIEFSITINSTLDDSYTKDLNQESLNNLVNYLKKTLYSMIKISTSNLKFLKKSNDPEKLQFLLDNNVSFYEDLLVEDIRTKYTLDKKIIERFISIFNLYPAIKENDKLRKAINPSFEWQGCLDILISNFLPYQKTLKK